MTLEKTKTIRAKRKRRKPTWNPELMLENVRLDVELSKYLLYEYTMQTTMAEESFSLANKRRLKDYVL